MENASKALIIAGAILISILLIGVSMMIFNGASDIFTNANQTMNKQAIQAFNDQWKNYEGRKKGSEVRELISTLITNASDDVNGNDNGKLPAIKIDGNDSAKADITQDGNVDAYVQNLSNMRKNIIASKMYEVTCEVEARSGLINNIIIKEITSKADDNG